MTDALICLNAIKHFKFHSSLDVSFSHLKVVYRALRKNSHTFLYVKNCTVTSQGGAACIMYIHIYGGLDFVTPC